ncbi:MAG TPA: ABC transporter permease subunit [Acidimicrobiales bacterium]
MKDHAGERAPRSLAGILFNIRVLRVVGQAVAILVLLAFALYLQDNYRANTRHRRNQGGWGFLDEPTGFGIAYTDFRPGQPVRDALMVGVRNTLVSAVVGIVLATVLGVLVGVLRLSRSWVARKAATLYVEVLRNVPVLLIILFTGAWLRTLPRHDEAWTLGSLVEISNREIVLGPATLNIPYVALTAALAVYHGSHIAEIVRGSIQAVPHGQTEAATAIGLSDVQRLRYVVLPQAVRIALPPTISQYLSLTKNTSLGIAVAYSDVASLGFRLIGARSPALQTIVVLMVVYLTFSLTTSLVFNVVNRRMQLVER